MKTGKVNPEKRASDSKIHSGKNKDKDKAAKKICLNLKATLKSRARKTS